MWVTIQLCLVSPLLTSTSSIQLQTIKPRISLLGPVRATLERVRSLRERGINPIHLKGWGLNRTRICSCNRQDTVPNRMHDKVRDHQWLRSCRGMPRRVLSWITRITPSAKRTLKRNPSSSKWWAFPRDRISRTLLHPTWDLKCWYGMLRREWV